ncbi:hypothetical protein ALC53_08434 [Atta colombica]|uniref:Uncharacterized protein n=1 Tax=Atta colombica TaxID=520822 RepID=A0A195B976_9HYME|nr:hypothetical protein ALC53_08434 [Atta colombica]
MNLESTCYGLTISFKTAQDLHFSDTKVRFQIFINAPLNQDNLKVYNILFRHDAELLWIQHIQTFFIQMYKLMSSYLLIKSPKGSNPSGRRFTNVLMSVRHESNKTTAIAKIDYVRLCYKGKNVEILAEAASALDRYDYFLYTSEFELSYSTGYIARKGSRIVKFRDRKQLTVFEDCLKILVLS